MTKSCCLLAMLLLSAINTASWAQQQNAGVTINASAESSLVNQEIQSERNEGKVSANTVTIEPRVTVDYSSRRFQGRWSANLTHLNRDIDAQSRTDNFTEYLYNARFIAIENLLTFNARGALNYQNVQSDGYLLNDFFLNSDELAKTRSNQFSVNSNVPAGNYFGASGSLSYSDTQSEAQEGNNQANLDNNSYSGQGRLESGRKIEWLSWSLDGSYQNTERQFQNNFISRQANGVVSFKVVNNFGFSVNAQHEANQLGNNNLSDLSSVREFNSYGAGLTWREGNQRYFTLSYNTSDSDLDDQSSNFIGVDFSWNFTTRTRISGNYGRRFFGESGQFSFAHNTKALRTQITYSEDVTSFSRLIANPENLGVFVCQNGINDLTQCFQPNTLNYQLLPGEQFVQFSQQNAEINDEIILRKGLNGQIGYDFGRVRVSLDARYALDDYLEIDRLQRTYSVGFNSTLQIGAYTNLTASVNYAEVEQRSTEFASGISETWQASAGMSREIGQHISASLEFRYLDRDGTLQTGFGGQTLQDRRVSVSVRYTY